MSRPPAMQFFCKDWIADTAGLTHFQEACYMRLMCAARVQSDDWCSLPNDPAELARICHVGARTTHAHIEIILKRFFVCEEGRWVHPRLREEAEIQKQRREQQRLAGEESARRRAAGGQQPFNIRSILEATSVEHPAQRESNSASASVRTKEKDFDSAGTEGGSAELARSSAKPSSPDPRIETERLRQLDEFKARYGA